MNAPTVVESDEDHARDWDLVRCAQAGDMNAYGQLYHRYYDTVMGYLHNRVGDRHLAEDLTGETFLRALRRIDSVSYQGRSIGAWLIIIARNLMLDHFKSSRVRLEQPVGDDPMHVADQTIEADPAREVAHNQLGQLLDAAMGQLCASQTQVLRLRFYHDMPIAQVSEMLGSNDGAIKAVQHRAVRNMRRLLPQGTVDYLT